MSDFLLRAARQSDAADLAILDNIAGHGFSMWFWEQAVISGEGDNAIEVGRERFKEADAIFGWKNATVAEEDGMIVGSVTSYIMAPTEEPEGQFKREASAFEPLFELFDQIMGHWFIDSLAVYRSSRGRGVSSLLIDDSLSKAKLSDAKHASLVVEDTNLTARNLYERRGFKITDRRDYIEFNGSVDTNEWLLLTVQL